MMKFLRRRSWWAIGLVIVACDNGHNPNVAAPTSGTSATIPSDTTSVPVISAVATLVGAGDIADCENEAGAYAEATAKLLDSIDGTVFTAGDDAYPDGSAERFANCYGPRWGRHKSRTRPAAGNHEYQTAGAGPYFDYFGAAAGPAGLGYYSYSLGAWHVIVLNSNIPASSGTAQALWLADDLQANKTLCTAAIYHHPRFSSGPSGGGFMADVWRLLHQQGVDLVINGHDHGYERFAPMDGDGRADSTRGMREFLVGSGGAYLYPFGSSPNSELHLTAYGVLRLTLRSEGYDWAFIDAVSKATIDSGSASCH